MNKIICFILICFLVLGFSFGARGQQVTVTEELENPINYPTFAGLFAGIMTWVLSIVGLIAVGMIIYGGFQYIFSGGAESKTTEAKNTIRNAIIGLIIVLLSYAFLAVIKDILDITMIKMFIA